MTDRKQALQDLRDKVAAGDKTGVVDCAVKLWPNPIGFSLTKEAQRICNAFNGSLDAAKALHDAVLPGWYWDVDGENEANVGRTYHTALTSVYSQSQTPARAWLLAILEALSAKEDAQ